MHRGSHLDDTGTGSWRLDVYPVVGEVGLCMMMDDEAEQINKIITCTRIER